MKALRVGKTVANTGIFIVGSATLFHDGATGFLV
jgi:hypothetical protein